MNFYNYMMKNHLNEKSPRGDLARDMKEDRDFPKNKTGKFKGWKRLIKNYLESQSACYHCMMTFENAWREYENCERKRLNLPLLKE